MSYRIILILFIFLIIVDNDKCFAKTRPIGFSAVYKHLDINDWNVIKKKIDTIFSFNTLQEALEKKDKENNDISDLAARIGEINWRIEQRKEISDYLLQTLIRIFVQKGFIDSIKNKKIIIESGVTYQGDCVYEMIYAYGRVCNEIDVEKIDWIWNHNTDNSDFSNRLRRSLINILELQIESEKAIELAKKWQKQLFVNNNMLLRLNTVIEYHEYAKIESEKAAWELLWERYKPTSDEYFLDTNYCNKIYLAFYNFVNARTKYNRKVWCNPAITFEISNQSDTFEKQYFFISFTIDTFFRQCTYSNSDIDLNFIDNLKKAVNKSSEIIKKNGYLKTNSHADINEIIMQNFLKNIETALKKENKSQKNNTANNQTQYYLSSDNSTVIPEDQGEDFSLLSNEDILKETKKFIATPPDSRAYSTNSQTGEKILMIPEPPDDEPSAILSTNNQQSING
ncbi:MAG: hypothetical protein LBE18_12850, partial [Planctomycetaceae bacterium]|nr:hypothetical protein [Planctomycetaceae bacterium]